MSNDDMTFKLGFESDQQSTNEAKRMVDDVQAEFDKLTRTTKEASDQIQSYFKSPGSNGLGKSLLEIEEAAKDAEKALKKMHDQAAEPLPFDEPTSGRKAGGGGGGSGGSTPGLPDNAQTAAGRAGALAGAVGSATGNGALGAIGDAADVAEQFAGLGKEVGALGTIAPVAGVALAAVTVAVALYNDSLAEQRMALQAAYEAQERLADLVVSGASTEDAEEELRTAQKSLEEWKKIQQDRKALYEEEIEDQDFLKEQLDRVFSGYEDDLAAGVKEADAEVAKFEGSIESLTVAIEEGKFAAEDAANALLDQAAAAGDLLRLELEAGEATKEANESRLKGIERQRAALGRELEVLQAAGSEHEDVAERIKSLTEQMSNLDQQTNVLKTAIQNAGDTAEESAKQIEGSNETRKSEGKEVEKVAKEVKGSMLIIGGAQNKMMQAQAETVVKQAEEQMKAYEDQRKAAIAHNQRVLESLEDFNAKREDLLTSGDFLGAFQQERDFRRDLSRMQNQFANAQGNTYNSNSIGAVNFPITSAMNPEQLTSIITGIARQEIQTILVNP